MMPRPSGSASSCRAGGGFVISKSRWSMNPAARIIGCAIWACGTNKNTIGMLAISSNTIAPGSFTPPNFRTAAVHSGMPIQQRPAITSACSHICGSKLIAQLSGRPHKAPQVPGANGIRPAQNPVARNTATEFHWTAPRPPLPAPALGVGERPAECSTGLPDCASIRRMLVLPFVPHKQRRLPGSLMPEAGRKTFHRASATIPE